jgi:deferrochelatase/peroxidase EfeB
VFIVHKGGIPIVIERREMEWVPDVENHNTIGFKDDTEENKSENSTEEKTLSDKEEMEQTLKDVASTISALFRGEVDISELN